MAINNFNNSIGFPRLTNNPSGMFMTAPVSAEAKPKPVEIPEKTVSSAQNHNAQNQKNSDMQKYLIGASAVAASAIAGIYLYNSRGKNVKAAESLAEEVLTNSIPKTVEHMKDNFLAAMGKAPDLDFINKHVKSLNKRVRVDENGKSILKGEPVFVKRGISIVDERLQPAALVQRTFVTDDGKVLARVDYDGDGNVWQYFVKDSKGNIIRDYNFSEPGLTTKKVYNKDNKLILDIQHNDKGWTSEVRYNEDGTVKSTNELNPHLKDSED